MIKIELDNEGKKFMRHAYEVDVDMIFLESNTQNLLVLNDMINSLLNDRMWSNLSVPYRYNRSKKTLSFFGTNSIDEIFYEATKLKDDDENEN